MSLSNSLAISGSNQPPNVDSTGDSQQAAARVISGEFQLTSAGADRACERATRWLAGASTEEVLYAFNEIVEQLGFSARQLSQFPDSIVLTPRRTENFAAFVAEVRDSVFTSPLLASIPGKFSLIEHPGVGPIPSLAEIRYAPDPANQKLQQAVALMLAAEELLSGEAVNFTRRLDGNGYPMLVAVHRESPPTWQSTLGRSAADILTGGRGVKAPSSPVTDVGELKPCVVVLSTGDVKMFETAVQAAAAYLANDGIRVVASLELVRFPNFELIAGGGTLRLATWLWALGEPPDLELLDDGFPASGEAEGGYRSLDIPVHDLEQAECATVTTEAGGSDSAADDGLEDDFWRSGPT